MFSVREFLSQCAATAKMMLVSMRKGINYKMIQNHPYLRIHKTLSLSTLLTLRTNTVQVTTLYKTMKKLRRAYLRYFLKYEDALF